MGMYTEFVFVGKISGDAPSEVIEALKVMCASTDNEVRLPKIAHPFFSLDRAPWMFQSNSYYHTPASVSEFERNEIGKFWTLIVRCDLKNYEDEIEQFVDWVTPYLEAINGDHLGWSRYEECKVPTLLFHPNDWRKPSYPDIENEGWR